MYSDDRYQSLAKHTRHYENVPFEVPESWEWIQIKDVCEVARGGSPRPIKDYLTNDPSGVNWIKIGDTTKDGKYIDSAKEKIKLEGVRKSRIVHKGDFLLTNSMSFGRPYILRIDGCIHDGWLVISPMSNSYQSDFLYYLLSSIFAYEQFSEVASGGVLTNLNSDKVADSFFPLPPYKEQIRIVEEIEKWFALIDTLESAKEDLRTSISQAKSKILDLAIHGKLVPQDPNDEPAIELLKRINPKFTPCDNGHDEKKEIPDSWIWCTLHDSFNITMGSSPTGDALNREKQGVEFHQGKVFFSNKNILPSDIYTTQPVKMAEPHSILLCVRAPVGTVNITDRQICIGRGLCSLMPSKSIDLQYAYYVLQTCSKELEQKATGSTFKAVSGDIVKKQLIPFPPYNEQLRIVKRIEELFAVLDEIQKSIEA